MPTFVHDMLLKNVAKLIEDEIERVVPNDSPDAKDIRPYQTYTSCVKLYNSERSSGKKRLCLFGFYYICILTNNMRNRSLF